MSELTDRLRKHPVICMDKQNITNDAADRIENLEALTERQVERNGVLTIQVHDLLGRDRKLTSALKQLGCSGKWEYESIDTMQDYARNALINE